MSVTRSPMPRWTVVFLIVWNVVGISIFTTVTIAEGALVFLPMMVVPVLAMAFVLLRQRRRVARRSAIPASAVTTSAVAPDLSGEPDAVWTGGGSFPGWMGTMEASGPIVVLELYGDVLRLRVRPGFLGALFGMLPLVGSPSGVAEVFPSKRRFLRGVGFRTPDDTLYHLWTADADTILIVLHERGFPVSWQEQRYSRWR